MSALVERLTRSETELRQRAERAEARLGVAEHPDEATLLEVLGSETTRVLTSAHEAAVEVRAKAEAAAERLVADATAQAAEIRSKATAEVEAAVAAATAENESMLESARTALARQTAEAESVAAGIRAAAEEHAQTVRSEADQTLVRVRDEAATIVASAADEAATILDAARAQGKEMVAEASAVRERVLRDLRDRRKRARQQVEKLNAGRERLLEAYDLVRRTTDEATNELTVSIIDARVAANAAARRVEDEPDTTLEDLDAEAAAAGLIDLPIMELDDDHDDEHDDDHDDGHNDGDDEDGSSPLSGEVPAIDVPPTPVDPPEPPEDPWVEPVVQIASEERRGRRGKRKKPFDGVLPGEVTVVTPPDPTEGVRIIEAPVEAPVEADEVEDAVAEAAVVEVAPVEASEPVAEPPALAEEAAESTGSEPEVVVTEVFARLRSESEVTPDEKVPADAEVPTEAGSSTESVSSEPRDAGGDVEVDEPGPFVERAQAVAHSEKELGRALKRALADEQNEVLDLLRRAKPTGADDLLPAQDLHVARWAAAAAESLGTAARAGADTGATPAAGATISVDDLAEELARSLVGPLRERIDRGFAASDGNLDDIADRVRALYREWRGQRLVEASQHYASAAYALGLFDSIGAGTKVHWVIDPSVGPCPDCDDNVLAGAITKGEEFPTGNQCAPAHPGCHCLVVAVSD